MKILVWNMAAGFGHDSKRHDAAWRFLRDADPDIALLQEAVVPAWAKQHWSYIAASPKYPVRTAQDVPWGCAIVSLNHPFEELETSESFPCLRELLGCVVVARLRIEQSIWLASIHSNAYPLSAERLSRFAIEEIRRCHATDVWEVELIAHELERLFLRSRFVVGGDLNSALLFDSKYGRDANARLFANLADAGFCDLRAPFFNDEQQTYFKPRMGPYQLDHVFGDAQTLNQSRSWRVLTEAARDLQLSDHAPVEVQVDLT